jgi:uncharacterized protein (DUF1501 family)
MSLTNRRAFLLQSAALGCSLAASPLVTPVSFAAAPGDARLVVIILRGGVDGLDLVRPYGDPAFAALRPSLAGQGASDALDLDGFYGLHPAAAPLMPLWAAGELGFVQAVSTPYRDKRSHFDGQDLLEAGTTELGSGARDGWLNRMLQDMPGHSAETAYAIGAGNMQILSGAAAVANWTPETTLPLSPQAENLMELMYAEDPALMAAFAEARMLSDLSLDPENKDKKRKPGHIAVAEFAAERLQAEARIAAFSLNGWDTHKRQDKSMPRALGQLSDTILALKAGLTPSVWQKTAILAITEFGR